MKRRGFLKLLALLPFAPVLAEAVAKTINKPLDMKQVAKVVNIDLANGSDQTSMWLVNWSPHNFRQAGKSMTMMEVARYYQWNGLPVIEALSQKNSLLQDMVWKEGNMTSGHRVSWDTKWAHEQIDLWGNK